MDHVLNVDVNKKKEFGPLVGGEGDVVVGLIR